MISSFKYSECILFTRSRLKQVPLRLHVYKTAKLFVFLHWSTQCECTIVILILMDSEWPNLSSFMSSSDHKPWKAGWVSGMAFIKRAHHHWKPHCCHQQWSAVGLLEVDALSVCTYIEIFSFICTFMLGLPPLLKDHLVESGIRVTRWGYIICISSLLHTYVHIDITLCVSLTYAY